MTTSEAFNIKLFDILIFIMVIFIESFIFIMIKN